MTKEHLWLPVIYHVPRLPCKETNLLSLFSPEAWRYVLPFPTLCPLIHPLVCRASVERSQMLYIWPDLDIVEAVLYQYRTYDSPSGIPGHLEFRVYILYIYGHIVDIADCRVASHERHACYGAFVFLYHLVNDVVCQLLSVVAP